jgi:hypothetical protein
MQGSESVSKFANQKHILIGRRKVDQYLLSPCCGSRFLSVRSISFFLSAVVLFVLNSRRRDIRQCKNVNLKEINFTTYQLC